MVFTIPFYKQVIKPLYLRKHDLKSDGILFYYSVTRRIINTERPLLYLLYIIEQTQWMKSYNVIGCCDIPVFDGHSGNGKSVLKL